MKKYALVLALALAGCTSENAIEVSSYTGGGEVQLITLKNGTRCAVLIGFQKGAISCDWERK